jgi:DNA-directed RNA polymerase specialized sigma24 family protein
MGQTQAEQAGGHDRPMGTLDWAGIHEALLGNPEDELAWFSLEQRVRGWAHRALWDRGRAVIDDAVADTCADVAVSIKQARGPETFAGFCYGQFLNVRRRYLHASAPHVSIDDVDLPAGDVDGPDPVEVALLRECLERLAARYPRQRHAVHLCYFCGRTPVEAASDLQTNGNHARQILHRGLAHLRRCVQEKMNGS